jgi:hypothetical protein
MAEFGGTGGDMTELSTSAIEWCITNCDAYVYSEEARKELAALIEAAEPVTPADVVECAAPGCPNLGIYNIWLCSDHVHNPRR